MVMVNSDGQHWNGEDNGNGNSDRDRMAAAALQQAWRRSYWCPKKIIINKEKQSTSGYSGNKQAQASHGSSILA